MYGGIALGGLASRTRKITITAPTGAEQDSGWDLPTAGFVSDILVNVRTAEATGATKTLDIGLLSSESGGDADGFVDGLSVSSVGLKRFAPAVTAGGTESYISSWTRGVFMTVGLPLAGANVVGDVGTYYEKPHMIDAVTARSISYTSGSAFTELVADIYIVFTEVL